MLENWGAQFSENRERGFRRGGTLVAYMWLLCETDGLKLRGDVLKSAVVRSRAAYLLPFRDNFCLEWRREIMIFQKEHLRLNYAQLPVGWGFLFGMILGLNNTPDRGLSASVGQLVTPARRVTALTGRPNRRL